MKKYLLWILEKSAAWLVIGASIALWMAGIVYAAWGNGLFADVLDKIVSSGDYQSSDGTVRQATKVLGGTNTDIYTSNGTEWVWTGAMNVKVWDSDKVDGLHASELSAAWASGVAPRLFGFITTKATCPDGYENLGNDTWQVWYNQVSTEGIAWIRQYAGEIAAGWSATAPYIYFNKVGILCLKAY
jgi:hypothetical protein